jgi:Uma2 family endonuclease
MSTASSLIRASPSYRPRPRAVTVVVEEKVRIPPDIVDLESFCNWAISEDSPEQGHVSYFHGQIWVDLSMEELYTHNQIKAEIDRVILQLARASKAGRYIPDGMLLRNAQADLSTEPDGMFVSYEAFRTGRVKRMPGKSRGIFQLEGTPEMVLEVVSGTTVQKDTVELRELYWKAGISEYWLVDARLATVHFDLLRRGPKGYSSTRRQAGGWVKSNVFGKSFRLTMQPDPLGDPQPTLEMRD